MRFPLTVLITAFPAVPVSLVESVMTSPTHDACACPEPSVATIFPVVLLIVNVDPVVLA